MKANSKILLAAGAGIAALCFLRKKKGVAGLGKLDYGTYDFLLSQSEKWRNDMLDRMRLECEQWIRYVDVWGLRMAKNTYHLFAGNPRDQIETMRILRRTLGSTARVSTEQIDDLAKQMGVSGIGGTDWYHALQQADLLGIDFSIPYHANDQYALHQLEQLGKKMGYRNSTEVPYGRAFFYALQKKRKNFLRY